MSEADDNTNTVSVDEHSKVVQELERVKERSQKFESEAVNNGKQLDKFKKYDFDKLTADSQALQDLLKQNVAGDNEATEKLFSELTAKANSEKAELTKTYEAKIKTLSTENHEHKVVDRVMNQVGAKFNEDVQGFIKDLMRSNVYVDDTGNLSVKDGEGKQRYNNQHTPMTVDEYANELAEKHPSFARAQMQAGSKQPGQRTNGASNDVQQYLRMSKEQRQSLDPAVRRKLASESMSHLTFNKT